MMKAIIIIIIIIILLSLSYISFYFIVIIIIFCLFLAVERNFWILEVGSFFYWNEMFLIRINFS